MFLKNLSLALGGSYLVKWELQAAGNPRFDCHPEELADEAKCKARGCIWEVRGDTDELQMHMYYMYIYELEKKYVWIRFLSQFSRAS